MMANMELTWRDYCPCCGSAPGVPHDRICIEIHEEMYMEDSCNLSIFEQESDRQFATRQAEVMNELDDHLEIELGNDDDDHDLWLGGL